MLDLSPEKIMALLAVGLVVLGPHRLPTAARSLAQGLAKARRLAETLTQPVHASLAEPANTLERTVAEVREAVHGPAQALSSNWSKPLAQAPPVGASTSPPAEADRLFDPADN
jgi:Sec-independent protein translocase protein TatA